MSLFGMELIHTVTFQAPVESQDSTGGVVKTWSDVIRDVPACVWPKSATAQYVGSDGVLVTHKVYTEPIEGYVVNEAYRIVYEGRVFSISGFRDPGERGEFWVFDAYEAK